MRIFVGRNPADGFFIIRVKCFIRGPCRGNQSSVNLFNNGSITTIPSFHVAYQENGRKKHCDSNKL